MYPNQREYVSQPHNIFLNPLGHNINIQYKRMELLMFNKKF